MYVPRLLRLDGAAVLLFAHARLPTRPRRGSLHVIHDIDTAATTEIRVGDNDRLAARVAAMLGCDTLVLLSDIDGLYTADPRQDPNAAFIPEVAEITPEIEAKIGRAHV